MEDLAQAQGGPLRSAFVGGDIFNLSNLLLVAAIDIAGMSLSIIACGAAGFAVSYGLGQGATLVAAFWGVFIWKEFNNRWQAALSPIRSVRRRACSLSSSKFAPSPDATRASRTGRSDESYPARLDGAPDRKWRLEVGVPSTIWFWAPPGGLPKLEKEQPAADPGVVRLAGFEPATFGSGGRKIILHGLPRVVKKLGPPVTARRLMGWKREWAAISVEVETAQFQARASGG